jgi:NAD(P)-dependent dehydrogenase (short-subunit alcohol dehydrogenase family)
MKYLLLAGMLVATSTADDVNADAGVGKPTVLITGSNRGIGLEFVRQLAARDWRVIATARRPADATELKALAADDADVVIEYLDVTDHDGIDALAETYRDQPIDILLLNAAMGPTTETAGRRLAKLDFDVARQSFEVNTIGPMKVAQAFMPNVEASQKKLVLAMSSDSGSFVAGSKVAALYHYKASKAALNMYFHTLHFETRRKDVTAVLLHPGLVGTNPQLARFPGALTPEDSVRQLLTVIDNLTPADNGRFVDYRGETMPW